MMGTLICPQCRQRSDMMIRSKIIDGVQRWKCLSCGKYIMPEFDHDDIDIEGLRKFLDIGEYDGK